MAASDPRPVLWHIAISHYSEKARWALDHKRVPHRRRAVPIPGIHIPASMLLTRGASQTYPVLELDGRAIGDSTEIIAALEQRHPEPPLYPADPEQRRRALALEDFFDEELGPHVRLLAFHELGRDRERFEALVERTVPAPVARLGSGAVTCARTYTGLRFGVRDEAAAELARAKILAALDRLEAELDGGEYLVGDCFGVADLSAAALFFPLVMPDEGPLPNDLPLPAGLEDFRASLRERAGYRWVEETYRRHRQPTPAGTAAPA
ncbi:MAG TPA: glutathione S-transferase family protein [Solirubrobacterales bacterium]|nr:glutathione S-transferase family protein [Solirubrobacterales bacterium]